MRKVFTRPFHSSDARQLDLWRDQYLDADLEIPHGYIGPNVETVIAHRDGKTVQSLTGILSVVLDPLIRDPNADSMDVIYSLRLQENVLTYKAQELGAVDAYIAVPKQLEHYIELLKGCGYQITVQNCVVMRRPLRPDHVPLIGAKRDAAEAAVELTRPPDAPPSTDVK